MGCRAVIVRSFARIHETNLKKQGVLPLSFVDRDDYERVQRDDRVSLNGLATLAPGSTIAMVLCHSSGDEERVLLQHTMNTEQIKWFKAGSALNRIRARGRDVD